MYVCSVCNTPFASRITLQRHNSTVERCLTNIRQVFSCTVESCTAKYHRNDFLLRHQRKFHGINKPVVKRAPAHNRIIQYPGSETSAPREPIIVKAIVMNENPPEKDPGVFLESLKATFGKILSDALQQYQTIVFQALLQTKLLKASTENGTDRKFERKAFRSKDTTLRSSLDVEDTVNVVTELIAIQSENDVKQSDLNVILHLEISIRKMKPLQGGFIPVHPDIVTTKAVLNVKNSDPYCFKWAILSSLSTENKLLQNMNLTYSYGINDITQDLIQFFGTTLNFSNLSFPMEVRNVRIFERNNPAISVNVFGVEELGSQIVGPLYRTRREKAKHVNLLFCENSTKTMCHYMWIKSLPMLLRKQLIDEYIPIEICNTCLRYFTSRKGFDDHKADPKACFPFQVL